MAKKAAEQNETDSGVSSNSVLESFLKSNKDDHFTYVKPKENLISSGSLQMDSLIKVRSGSVVRLAGKQAEAGKTSQAFVFSENYMKTMPRSKTLYVKAEGRLSPEMKARVGLKFVDSPTEWSYGTVFVLPCNIFETVAELIENLLKSMKEADEYLCVIIDSLDGLILKNDLQAKSIGDSTMVAGVPKLTKLMFRRLSLPINHYDALLLFTSQYSVDIKLDPYSPNVPRQVDGGGGSAANHQNDYTLSYQPRYAGDLILEDPNQKPDMYKNKQLGVYATVEFKKSASDVTGMKVRIPIKKGRVGCAIWVEKEIVDMIVGFELIKKAGAWFSFSEELIKEAKESGVVLKEKMQGMNAIYEYLEEDKSAFNFFFNKVKKIIE